MKFPAIRPMPLATVAMFSAVLVALVGAQQAAPHFSASSPPPAASASARPKILGIASVRILTTDLPAARGFFAMATLSEEPCVWCEKIPAARFALGGHQLIELDAAPTPAPSNLLAEITFSTNDLAALKRYFKGNDVPFTQSKTQYSPERISVLDPEGHSISFTKPSADLQAISPVPRIIHAGFIVHDQAAEDRFYKDILGFHVYWHGGIKDDETSWVDMQVPDGTDWIEYMLNVSPQPDHHTLGVMNHIALGVPDIKAVEKQLLKNGWRPGEEPQIGRDGKWQLNLYDPDDTRVEFMEFKPTEKPCCSDYAGPHPGPNQ
jgi:catechol 2,3-dioxygenase-like lactoylglutathione lyase family enzyme